MDSGDPRIGTVLQGRYRIIEPIAQGGMGVVYRAERIGLERPVAIKFLHTFVGEHREAVARFEREARAMSKLTHPHCVPVIDFGVADEAPYIVMEYVQGRTLLELLANGPVPAGRAIQIVSQVLSGLAHAHGQGIVHRDIKPANIVLVEVTGTGDHARILDFGLAKLLGGPGVSWSTAQTAVGTPSYMSPEQCRGEEADARTDQYAVGVMLYELITGKKPFYGKDPYEVLKQHINATPPPLSRDGGPQYSRELEAVVRRTLAKQPGDRYASALELRDALTATPEGQSMPRPFSSASFAATGAISVEQRSKRVPDEAAVTAPILDGDEVRDRRRGRRARGAGMLFVLALVGGLAFAAHWAKENWHGMKIFGLGADAGWPDAGADDANPIDASLPDAPGPADAAVPDAAPDAAADAGPDGGADAAHGDAGDAAAGAAAPAPADAATAGPAKAPPGF